MIGISLCLFLRRPDAILNPQFWAEDGAVFFKQNFESGPLFFTPYAGYLHLIPRIIAYFSSFAPICIIPTIYNYFSFITTIFVAYKIMGSRWHVPYKPLIAFSIILVPHSGEIFLNITNLQWITAILFFIFILQDDPKNLWQMIIDYSLLVIIGLTGPFVILFAPLLLFRLFIRGKSINNIIFIIISMVLALIQMFFLLKSNLTIYGNSELNIDEWLHVIVNRFSGSLFFGAERSEGLNRGGLSLLMIGLIMFIIYSVKGSKYKEYLWVLLSAEVLIFISVFYKFRYVPDMLIPFNNGDRYFYLIRLIIIWSLIIALKHYNRHVKTISLTILMVILFSSLMWYQNQKFIDYKWKTNCKIIKDKPVRIPINPDGWFIQLNINKE